MQFVHHPNIDFWKPMRWVEFCGCRRIAGVTPTKVNSQILLVLLFYSLFFTRQMLWAATITVISHRWDEITSKSEFWKLPSACNIFIILAIYIKTIYFLTLQFFNVILSLTDSYCISCIVFIIKMMINFWIVYDKNK